MGYSLIHPLACGFARVSAWQIARQVDSEVKCKQDETAKMHQVRQNQERFDRFVANFKGFENFNIDKYHFLKTIGSLRLKFRNWNPRLIAERDKYTEAFSVKNWENMSHAQKCQHKLHDCNACMCSYSHLQSLFPVKSRAYHAIKKRTPLADITEVVHQQLQAVQGPAITQKQAAETALALYNKINPTFEKNCSMSLAKALTKSPELQLEEKQSKSAKRKKRREHYRKAKEAVQEAWEETSVIR